MTEMAKKKKITKGQSEGSSKKIPAQEEEESYGEFGGFPDRDLKRNLGCG